MPKQSREAWLEKANKKHNNYYDYSKAIDIASDKFIIIICPKHGEFDHVIAGNHLKGAACKLCKKRRYHPIASFIEKANKVWNNKYDYSQAIYTGDENPVKNIRCKEHGLFDQRPGDHKAGKQGCATCQKNNICIGKIEFIRRSIEKQGYYFDYSKIHENVAWADQVTIICPVHGEFDQRADTHMNGGNCLQCSIIGRGDNTRESQEVWLEKVNKKHNNSYQYDRAIYKGGRELVIVTCPKHNDFEIEARRHTEGHGCPKCNLSKGVLKIGSWLSENDIEYTLEKSYNDLRLTHLLRFDVYLTDYNVLIEFDGQQHFDPIECFGGDEKLIITKLRDSMKDDYCKVNMIHLLRMSYKDMNKVEYWLKLFIDQLIEGLPSGIYSSNFEEYNNRNYQVLNSDVQVVEDQTNFDEIAE